MHTVTHTIYTLNLHTLTDCGSERAGLQVHHIPHRSHVTHHDSQRAGVVCINQVEEHMVCCGLQPLHVNVCVAGGGAVEYNALIH